MKQISLNFTISQKVQNIHSYLTKGAKYPLISNKTKLYLTKHAKYPLISNKTKLYSIHTTYVNVPAIPSVVVIKLVLVD